MLEPDKRPVSAVADHYRDAFGRVGRGGAGDGVDLFMMFDPGHSLDERILSEQFRY